MAHLAAFALLIAITAAPAPAPNEAQDPTRIFFRVDCTEPFVVSLPDDVLTECE